ncbi:hypothetical protein G6F58_013269 [Rhizopus delemar]|nr:hypothetical protein G6F58_013269 [Rhizopus delemar]
MAILLLGTAAFFDQHRTSLDRPHDFYVSQFLASVGAGMFMGPLIMLGISAALKQGVDHMITFLVTLSITQTLGGLAGSAPARSGRPGGRAAPARAAAAVQRADHRSGAAQRAGQRTAGADHTPRSQCARLQ